MASNKKSNTSILGLFAFFAIIIKALAYVLSFFNGNLGILTFVADIIISAVALIAAWNFVKTCSIIWKIIYFVILILVIVGFVFGGLSL